MMSSHFSRPFSRADLPDLLELVSDNARARWPRASYLLTSDVAWRLPGSAPKDNLRLWYDASGLAAYLCFVPNGPITFDARPDLGFNHPVFTDMLRWSEARRMSFPPLEPWLLDLRSMAEWEQALLEERSAKPSTQRYLQLTAFDTDVARIRFLERNGFTASAHFAYYLARSLDVPIPPVKLPAGMRIRHVEERDYPARVELHRDAWFKSTFDLRRYMGVRAVNIFEPELDIVAETADGTLASYCIGWLDRKLGVGSFEPLGTRPAFRRLGLGQQVTFEGLRRMKQMGMHSAKIGTAGFNERAFALYTSCGFDLVDRERTWVKALV